MVDPLISALCPMYNRELLIESTSAGVLAQTDRFLPVGAVICRITVNPSTREHSLSCPHDAPPARFDDLRAAHRAWHTLTDRCRITAFPGAGRANTPELFHTLHTSSDLVASTGWQVAELMAGSIDRIAPDPCAVCLADVVLRPARHTALSERPWLPEYLDAIDLLRDLTSRGVSGLEVAGFGRHLLDLDPDLSTTPASAQLAWTDEEAFVRDRRRGRTFRLNRDAAPAVDALITTGAIDAAVVACPSVAVASAATQLAAIGLKFPTHLEVKPA